MTDDLQHLIAIATAARDRLKRTPKGAGDWFDWLQHANAVLGVTEESLAKMLWDVQANSLWSAAADLFSKAVGTQPDPASPFTAPHPFKLPDLKDYTLTGTETAAKFVRDLNVIPQDVFNALDESARRTAFTVARATTETVITDVRDTVANIVANGTPPKESQAKIRDVLDDMPLTDAHIETIYRTYVGRAHASGQEAAMANPMVGPEFPYALYSATHDSRVRKDHIALETMGLNGTAVYSSRDPFWQLFTPPWAWSCRCDKVFLSREDAAGYGCKEAAEWVRTGRPPGVPEYVRLPDFRPPPNWPPSGGPLTPV